MCWTGVCVLLLCVAGAERQEATGIVFHDVNANGKLDAGEPGLPGVRVSNQREVVVTSDEGRWRLPASSDTTFFVIKPRGWSTVIDPVLNLPRFYYTHKPAGSPDGLRYTGCASTGPLPASIDFPLVGQEEPERYDVILLGDTQSRDDREVEYLAHDIVPELMDVPAKFGVTLGDIVFNDLSVMGHQNGVIAQVGLPWYNVIGNHDHNFMSVVDVLADETFERYFGPNYYSFDYGSVHYIVLDNVHWTRKNVGDEGSYDSQLGARQLEFVANDLALVPKDQLVVLMMHIPIQVTKDREAFFALLKDRPHTLSISAHAHIQGHWFFTEADGWQGEKPHHHLVAITACGCWWQGVPDERLIPHALAADGVPNGYTIMTVDGHDYSLRYKAAGRPADYQMKIAAPYSVSGKRAAETDVVVNVFAGSSRSVVEMRVGGRRWQKLVQERLPDADFVALKAMEKANPDLPGRELPEVQKTYHTWRGTLPGGLSKGTHTIEVRTTDMFGQTYVGRRVVRIR